MTSESKDSQQFFPVSERVNIPGASSVVISLMTGPLIAGLMGARALSDLLIQAGVASEEIFRGERLPTLQNVPANREQLENADIE